MLSVQWLIEPFYCLTKTKIEGLGSLYVDNLTLNFNSLLGIVLKECDFERQFLLHGYFSPLMFKKGTIEKLNNISVFLPM
jgi:hypothetical protein